MTMNQALVGDGRGASNTNQQVPLLNTFPSTVQHLILLRELLLAFSGVEGQYIRLAASSTPATNPSPSAPSSSSKLPKLKDVSLLIDLDTAERSAANQVTYILSDSKLQFRI